LTNTAWALGPHSDARERVGHRRIPSDDLPAFFSTNSLIKIHLEERLSAGVIKAVEEGYAEVGICVSTTNSRDLFARPGRALDRDKDAR
jgi:hypothetical protein